MKKEVVKKNRSLKPTEELFCRLYAGKDASTFGNATRSYGVAFGFDMIDRKKAATARTHGCVLLTKSNIRKRCDELLKLRFNDIDVDDELNYVIQQRGNLSAKIQAIGEYNKLKERVKDTSNDLNIAALNAMTETLKAIAEKR